MKPPTSTPRTLIARRTGGICPGCRETIQLGDPMLYEDRSWPWRHDPRSNGLKRRDNEVLWHARCINVALQAALCSQCGELHPDGKCLL